MSAVEEVVWRRARAGEREKTEGEMEPVSLKGEMVELNGTKKGALVFVTRPKAERTEGLPTL